MTESPLQTDSAFWQQSPYGLPREAKRAFLQEHIGRLQRFHARSCPEYGRLLTAMGCDEDFGTLEEAPYLPVRLFKEFDLKSMPAESAFKVLTSSGTTGQPSRIHLDRETAMAQTRVLASILKDFIGGRRLPMILVDHAGVVKDRRSFSARGAGILGMLNFGRDHFYLLDEAMNPDWQGLEAFLERHPEGPILLFGFTFMVWQHFYKALAGAPRPVDLSRGLLIHSGGWKKLIDQAVDNDTFKAALREACGLSRIANFYGMVEQVGSIFMECEQGVLHASIFSDILVRDPYDWRVLPQGREGVIELFSILPGSYPGHALLTEDLGVVLGEDDCSCGRKGRYFRVLGRIPRAEARGCSDTFSEVTRV
ncbi:MAG: acyl-protein synthetase [Magnetococcales bacterium]|nr:acyl-protein synthetase [Magnetococcales bacterium]